MKTIKIVSRWDSKKVLLCGKYESIKDCLEKNRDADLCDANLRDANLRDADLGGAYLRGAYLGGAYLRGAYLGGANLRGAYLRGAYLRGAYLGGADLGDANLRDADLGDAYLRGAYLGGANLRDAYLGGAYLRGAYLGGAKNYYDNHDFAIELVGRLPIKTFTGKEWSVIGVISVHRFCWGTIIKKYKRPAISICKKLAKAGFDEYYKHIKEQK